MAQDAESKELLLKTLEDLGQEDFKKFKFYMRLPKSKKANADRPDIAEELVNRYSKKAVAETSKILKKIGNYELAKKLQIKGVTRAPSDSISLEVQMGEFKRELQENLRAMYCKAPEGNTERSQQEALESVYTKLHISRGVAGLPDKQHEVLQMEMRGQDEEEESIEPCDIFKSEKPLRTMVTVGFAGIGKTFLVRKFVLDWANGTTNTDVDFIFPLPFRELNLEEEERFSLAELIQHFMCDSKAAIERLQHILVRMQDLGKRTYQSSNVKILFVLDGLDECRLKLDLSDERKERLDVTQAYPVEVLLAHLIKGNLLPCARLWITTRPQAARDIPPRLVDGRTEVKGFSRSQRLDYFRKRFPNDEEDVIEHIQKSRSIFIMCHMPIFCWLTATVLRDYRQHGKKLPETLTEMYTEFLLYHLGRSEERGGQKRTEYVKALAKMAFRHLMKKQQIFYESDLRESGLDASQVAKHSGVFTEVFEEVPPLKKYQRGKMFQFIHLSIQEYLAALYVMMSLFQDNKNVLGELPMHSEQTSLVRVHEAAIRKASESEGNLDLFLRFLVGLSLQCNQKLMGELLKAPENFSHSNAETVRLIEQQIDKNSPEENINLFYCLKELKDESLLKQIEMFLEELRFHGENVPLAMWSALLFFLRASDKAMSCFELRRYAPSEKGLLMLLPVVKASRKSVLRNCNLSEKSCEALASVLSSPGSLRELDLSHNDLYDDGLEALAAGLAKPQCTLQVLKLWDCNLSKKSCEALPSVLSSPCSLDLSWNDLGDDGLEALAAGLAKPQCTLEVLKLWDCNLSKKSCEALASVLSSSRTLSYLDLSWNDLGDDGLEALAAGLAKPQCTLEVLALWKCKLSKKSCEALASVLSSPGSLRELGLCDNDLGDDGLEALAAGLAKPQCTLEVLTLWKCKLSKKSCEALASVLSSPGSLRELGLCDNDLGDDGLEALAAGLAKPQCTLQVLRLGSCKLSKKSCEALASVLSSPGSLRELGLGDNDLGDDGLEALAAGLAKPQCTLEVLALKKCNLSKKSCEALASVLSSPGSLRELDLGDNDLGDDGLEALATGLAKPQCTLQVLRLEKCNLSKKSWEALASILSSPCSLRELDLTDNDLRDNRLEALAAGLAKPQCTLEVLTLKSCELSKKSCEALASVLSSPCSLRELELSWNDLGDDGLEALAAGLAKPQCTLQVLTLRDCNLSKKSCEALASVLSSPGSLRELDLSHNDLYDDGLEALAAGLAKPQCTLQVLKLWDCKLSKKSCEALASVLSSPCSLRKLELCNNDLGDDGLEALAAGLAKPECALQVLWLQLCKLSKKSCEALASVLSSPGSLRELDLSCNDLYDDGLEALAAGLAKPQCTLQVLGLVNCNLSKKSCEALASVLSSPCSLRELNLSGNDLYDDGLEALAAGLAKPQCTLQVLGLRDCQLSKKSCEALASVLSSPGSLRELGLGDNDLGDDGLEPLAAGLAKPECTLQVLGLSGCKLSKKSCEALASVLSSPGSLRELDLSHNDLYDDGLEALAAGLAKPQCTLQVLGLEQCELSKKSCEALASVLSSPCSLRELELSCNDLGDDGLEALAAGLAKPQCTLEVLGLNCCELSKKSCEALAFVLSSPCSLRELELSCNDLGDDGLEALAAGLAKPQCTLQVLELEQCELSKKSCEALASVLSSPCSLRKLDLGWNDLGNDGLEALAAGLAKPQCTLQVLALEKCNLSKKSCEALASVLSSPCSLRELDLGENDLRDDGLEALAAGLAKPQCTLQVLRLRHCELSKKSCEALASVLSSPGSLKELKLGDNDLGDDGLEALAAGLAKPQCTLQVLKLKSCNLSKKSCEALASVLSSPCSLRRLDLSNNDLGDNRLEALAAGLAKPQCTLQVLALQLCRLSKKSCEALASVLSSPGSLRELDLSANDLRDDGLEALAAGLAKPQCTLQVLALQGCKLSKKSCEALASVLSSPCSLRELDLSCNDLYDDGLEALVAGLAKPQCTLQVLGLINCKLSKKGCKALASVLSSPCSLRRLDLSYNDLCDDGLEALAAGLAKPQCTLQVLRLRDCQLSKKSCEALASVLSSPCRLRELDLSRNDLCDEGLEALAAGLAKPQCTLQVLGLIRCNLSKKSCEALAKALRSNPSHLQELNLWGNDIGAEGRRVLAEVQKDPRCSVKLEWTLLIFRMIEESSGQTEGNVLPNNKKICMEGSIINRECAESAWNVKEDTMSHH
ncbi:protein NLRC5-like isoform X4 [Syngnathus acus]|uniref:protein NLRC5-like isoform X4 n=1 Tax=Syngnathus acus TaxID=161584 RepID=UPI001885BAAE|nr:protein NLRC5-like isoform X4 [Syngnathus acus]